MKKILTPSKHLLSPHDQNADFVELFFDLVFVFAITRVTAITAHHLDTKHIIQSVVIFWMIWWGWSVFTTALNSANTRIAEVRLGVLLTTAIAFVMAANVSDAFGTDSMGFAIAYVAIRVMGVGLYIRVTSSLNKTRKSTILFSFFSLLTFTFVLIGAFTDPEIRIWWWLGAILMDLFAAGLSGRFNEWYIHPIHFAERHGLIVIIALGESLIVAASAMNNKSPDSSLLLLGGLTVFITCMAWWSYFAWSNEHVEHHFKHAKEDENVNMARDIYILMHFFIITGVIAFAVSFEIILAHPNEVLSAAIAKMISAGYILFVGGTGLIVWRASKTILIPRILLTVIAVAGIMLCINRPSQFALYIICGTMLFLSIIEWRKCRHL